METGATKDADIPSFFTELMDIERFASQLVLGQDPLVKPNPEVFAGLIPEIARTTATPWLDSGSNGLDSTSGYQP